MQKYYSDFPFTSTPYSHSAFPYLSVLGGGEMNSSDFPITIKTAVDVPKGFPGLPVSSPAATCLLVPAGMRMRPVLYPSVQVNIIQDSMTKIDHAAPQRISGNSSKFSLHTSQYNSGCRYSAHPIIYEHPPVTYCCMVARSNSPHFTSFSVHSVGGTLMCLIIKHCVILYY